MDDDDEGIFEFYVLEDELEVYEVLGAVGRHASGLRQGTDNKEYLMDKISRLQPGEAIVLVRQA